jgi:hypothetical protein
MTLRRPTATFEGPTPRTTNKSHSSASAWASANAKAAELRMGGYRDVILSVVKASEPQDPMSCGRLARNAMLVWASGASAGPQP